MSESDTPVETLDPADWAAFRARAHAMLDAAVDRMEGGGEGPVWRMPTEALKAAFDVALPVEGLGAGAVDAQIAALLPFGVGNTHPRFFGWVHGSGTPSQLVAEMAASAMNANLGGREHGAIHVEKQVIRWCREIFGFPAEASGLIVSGTSMATIVALKAAREARLGVEARRQGIGAARLVGYTSALAHGCTDRAFDMLGLGSAALRRVPVDASGGMDLDALRVRIAEDRASGLEPFVIVGTAGSVDLGTFDDLDALADLAAQEGLWFHVDGAFGALAVLDPGLKPRVNGIERADSLAFDFHKWLHVTYDAGCVLIRDEAAHRQAFSDRPRYLKGAERGLAAGNPWPVDYGPELSRTFRALKVWAQLAEHGTARLGRMIAKNCRQASYLGDLVAADPALELLAPVTLNICCFRYRSEGDADALNDEIVIRLQEAGIAAPSTTTVEGMKAIRVNITNHRTRASDLDLLVEAVRRIGAEILAERAGG
ncbi:pyridoxal phosphate-dependent decarboxylase family protein [Seohaeicola nanhaiensis]|uniref:Pyridoxal phosphate-dependent decarboxylase family protein n=1 Tax=Seohaeicola nanhaiensis TaxID=1387282 RepID=A0ABV9KK58_9RHOB